MSHENPVSTRAEKRKDKVEIPDFTRGGMPDHSHDWTLNRLAVHREAESAERFVGIEPMPEVAKIDDRLGARRGAGDY